MNIYQDMQLFVFTSQNSQLVAQLCARYKWKLINPSLGKSVGIFS
jgi:hypothetical protein